MLTCCLAWVLLTPGLAQAEGTVQQHTPIKEGYVNSPIPFYITIKNAQDWDPPEMPDVPGLTIIRNQGAQTSSSMHVVNGKMTQNNEVTYTFSIQAGAPGTYEIPAHPISVDGRTFMTLPVSLTFRKAENKGLLSVEVSGNPQKIYQGEATRLTMQILIKQFEDKRYNIAPDSREMWQLIDSESDWGPFTETMRDLFANRRTLRGREQTLQGDDGQTERYFLYLVQAEVRPMSTGPLDLSDIRIRMSYPMSLRRGRGFFSTGLEIDQVRPVEAEATGRPVIVEPLPESGRPSEFNGAVGTFEIETTASPTTVSVGDPITLNIKITDMGTSPADMDVAPAPELHRVESLDADFRVPRESLPGTASGRTKTFTQTIRARSDEVTSIPPIPYAYFDPETARYETAYSRPILLQVNAANTITSSDITGTNQVEQPTSSDNLHNVAGGLLANYTGADRLLANHGPPATIWLLVLLIVPPVFVIGFSTIKQGLGSQISDPDRIRSRKSGRNAMGRLADASSGSQEQLGAQVTEAICTYIADRTGQPSAGFMRGDAISTLSASDVEESLVSRAASLLATCEHLQYAGGSREEMSSIIDSARDLIKELETLGTLKTPKRGAGS